MSSSSQIRVTDEQGSATTNANPTTAPPSKTQQTLAAKQKYIENYDFQYCDESIKYEKVAKIGQGTFG